jgi:hypothetical protein
MSDLEPHLHAPVLEDPSVTRLLLRSADSGRCAGLLERAGAVATSVSIVLAAGGVTGEPTVETMEDWRPEHMRLELLVLHGDQDNARPAMRERLARSGGTWRTVSRPPGGRAASLAAAAEAAEHEFLLIGTGGRPPYDLVEPALSLMWLEGADVALVAAGSEDQVDPSDAEDPSAALSSWLGLTGPVPPGRLVVMRRWVARWLFHEITRAISPAEEVADRTRLLGIGIVQMATFPTDGTLSDT